MDVRCGKKQMGRWIVTGWVLLLPWVFAPSVEGQRAEAYEYMSASSPLKNGWTVTSQSLPGRSISTVVTPAPLGGSPNSNAGVTLVPTSAQIPTGAQAPYPTSAGNMFNQTPSTAGAGGGSWVWVPNQGMGTAPGGVPVITQPTLGITSTNAPTNTLKPPSPQQPVGVPAAVPGCPCNPPSSGMTASAVPPYTTGVPTVPFAPAPGLPGTIPTSGFQPSGTVPTAAGGTGGMTTAYYPYLTGNFQPIVATKNLPPGTYMGRGIFGQPTAYVDGQPMRNLFRYVFP